MHVLVLLLPVYQGILRAVRDSLRSAAAINQAVQMHVNIERKWATKVIIDQQQTGNPRRENNSI